MLNSKSLSASSELALKGVGMETYIPVREMGLIFVSSTTSVVVYLLVTLGFIIFNIVSFAKECTYSSPIFVDRPGKAFF